MKTLLLLLIISFYHTLLYGQNFKILSQLRLSDNQYFSGLQIDRNEYGIGIMNDKGVMQKEQTINSIPAGLGIMGDKILVLGLDLKKLKTVGYRAMLINKNNCSIIKEQDLFKKENDNRISGTLIITPYNNFCSLLFRQTNYNEGFNFFGPSAYDTKYLESSTIQLVTLNDKLEPKNVELKTAALNSYFAKAVADENKNIYICSFTNSLITVEKFDSTGKLVQKLFSPFSVKDKNPFFNCVMKNEKDNQQSIIVATSCNNANKNKVLNTIKFDFALNKVFTSGEILLNKEYLKNLKILNSDSKPKKIGDIEGLEPVQILDDAKRIVVIKEIKSEVSGSKGDPTTYYRTGSIITVFNKKTFETEHEIVIDKKLATFVETSHGIAGFLVNDFLLAITCENSGLNSFKAYLHKINLITGEVVKSEIEKEDIGKGWITYPMQVAWFNKKFIIPFFNIKSPFSYSFETEFKVIPY